MTGTDSSPGTRGLIGKGYADGADQLSVSMQPINDLGLQAMMHLRGQENVRGPVEDIATEISPLAADNDFALSGARHRLLEVSSAEAPAGGFTPRAGWRPADAFVALNLVAFLIMGAVFALDRTGRYHSPANIPEFFVYACVIAAILALVWPRIRRFDFPIGLLLLVEAGIVAHFCGGFVQVGGARLYDLTVLGIGYDNLVHGLNAFAGAAVIDHLLRQYRFGPALWHWLILGLVLGAGAVIEIVEYAVLQIVPTAGIGGYDNNARDLVSNLAGALAFLPFIRVPEPA